MRPSPVGLSSQVQTHFRNIIDVLGQVVSVKSRRSGPVPLRCGVSVLGLPSPEAVPIEESAELIISPLEHGQDL